MKLVGQLDHYRQGVDLYRLDQLPFGGGNKVPRFIEFFSNNEKIKTLVAMSDMGAHTFNALIEFYENQGIHQIEKMIFLENTIGMTDYQEAIRQRYQSHPAVKVHSGSTWKMFVLYAYYKCMRRCTVLGIGGHVKVKAPFFGMIFKDCLIKLPVSKVLHILPVSSGDMLKEFLKVADSEHHRFIGIMTGNPLSRLLLKYQFRHYKNVRLIKPKLISEEQYIKFGKKFYKETGISLDPVHSIQSMYLGNHLRRLHKENVVIWMTQPDTHYFSTVDQ